jgi:type I restriction enzyme M protein
MKATGRGRACENENAPSVIRKIHKPGTAPDPLRGLFEVEINGRKRVVEYEPDTEPTCWRWRRRRGVAG